MAGKKPLLKKDGFKATVIKPDATCTMISLEARAESRQDTIKQLESVGLEVNVIESKPSADGHDYGNAFSNMKASIEALKLAIKNKQSLLFTEDDIKLNSKFKWALKKAIKLNEVTYFYAHDLTRQMNAMYGNYTSVHIKAGTLPEQSVRPFQSNDYLLFTQCVYLPLELIQSFDLEGMSKLGSEGEGAQSFDEFLQAYFKNKGIMPNVVLPHVVQHLKATAGRDLKLKRGHDYMHSMSFRDG